MLISYYGSTGTLKATLTDEAGAAVSGATVTCTLTLDGTEVAGGTWPATMTEDGSTGVYEYTIASDLLARGRVYKAAITATKGGISRYAEVSVRCAVDTD